MSETEGRYAQIEKETTWACVKFSTYVLGKNFMPLLGTQHLNSLPPRILFPPTPCTIWLRKQLYTGGTLSRPHTGDKVLEITEAAVHSCLANLPVSEGLLYTYQEAQKSDALCALVMEYCQRGWPSKHNLNLSDIIKLYLEARGLHNDNLLLYNVLIPVTLQEDTIQSSTRDVKE